MIVRFHIIFGLLATLTGSCFGGEIPVTIEPHYKYIVTSNQVEHVRALAIRVTSPDELDDTTILIRNHTHPGVNYYALIQHPRQVGASQQFAIYRRIKVYCSHWPNKHFWKYPYAPPPSALISKPEWYFERSTRIQPLFIINGDEYEISHDPNELNRFEVYEILKLIVDGKVTYKLENGEPLGTPIDPSLITSIGKFRDEEFQKKLLSENDAQTAIKILKEASSTIKIYSSNPEARFRGNAYRGKIENGKLIITFAGKWIS